ncbi:hypothetical protein JWS13_09640 [Rhodococcus pseudokoreensis]|uniref:Uncharacterized protein n=1 Tax=Rhodococcus pseudokoreensis TaxID=2811421 RepID=A0A974WD96_9NOCA|nr:hypothetical protein JWS13_09640 [Rhodococcus pseudokoreensis]
MLPTVYSLVEPDTYDRCAAVPAWRPAAVLSHRTAAWLYGWLPEPTVVEATIPRGLRVTPPDWPIPMRSPTRSSPQCEDDAAVGAGSELSRHSSASEGCFGPGRAKSGG